MPGWPGAYGVGRQRVARRIGSAASILKSGTVQRSLAGKWILAPGRRGVKDGRTILHNLSPRRWRDLGLGSLTEPNLEIQFLTAAEYMQGHKLAGIELEQHVDERVVLVKGDIPD